MARGLRASRHFEAWRNGDWCRDRRARDDGARGTVDLARCPHGADAGARHRVRRTGDARGFPVILLHGFPDDVRAYDEVIGPLAKKGYRAIVPYLRGYGPTRFRDAKAPRMAEQAAIGQDVIDFADALKIQRFAVAGYDWGGRAAGITAAFTRIACAPRC